jgi:hypothetical protein
MTGSPTLGASRAAAGWPRRVGPPALALGAYVVVALLAFWPVEPFSRTRLLGCVCSDPVQEAWFLAWPAYAIRNLHNPLFSSLLEYPHGVNLALNTSMPLLGVLAAPIEWLRGPVAAFNAMMRLSFVASAASMCFVLHRLARWWPAAFLGGLLYGFSPYMIGQGLGHLFLTFVPLPPLILWCVHELCRRTEGPVVRLGLLLGALSVAQFLISIEVLVTTAVIAAVVLVVVSLRHPVGALERARLVAPGAGAAAALFVPLVAYPTWYFLRGPQHVVGPPHAASNLAPVRADLLGLVTPTLSQRIGPAHLMAIGTSFSAADRAENGVYLGIPLLLLCGYLIFRYRRDSLVVLGALVAGAGLVLSFGSPLVVDNHSTGIPLPFAVLTHLPLVQGLEALRFSLYEQLGAALVLAIGITKLAGRGPSPELAPTSGLDNARDEQSGASSAGRNPVLVAMAVGAVALVPLVPRLPYQSYATGLPTFFTTSTVSEVPAGSVMLTYPFDVDPMNLPMLWQAESGMRFAIFGGQASTPGPNGRATSAVAALAPGVVQDLFAGALAGTVVPAFSQATFVQIRAFCARYRVQTVVVEPLGPRGQAVVSYFAAALQHQPTVSGGVDVWTDVPALLAGVA